jgi:transmembrane sensor
MADEKLLDQALAWHGALASDDADWDAFTLWLEADPEHRRAYDEVALLDDTIARHRLRLGAVLPPETGDAAEPRRQPRRIIGWAAVPAAAALVFVLLPTLRQAAPPPQAAIYATGRGEVRDIALADGVHVALAPRSRLRLAAADRLVLDGAATFDVAHRPGRRLVVQAGGVSVQDIGTRFEIVSGPDAVRVGVSEGRIAASFAGRPPVQVDAGKALTIANGQTAEVRPMGEGQFASWRQGRLVYDDAPLSLVAADLSRYSGRRVTFDRALRSRRFSGVLAIGDGSKLVGNFANIMDLDIRPVDGSVRLVPRRHP